MTLPHSYNNSEALVKDERLGKELIVMIVMMITVVVDMLMVVVMLMIVIMTCYC